MLTVQITNGNKKETITVAPDAFFVVHFQVQGKQVYMPFFFELDRGTEGVKQFKRKIEGLLTAVYSKEAEKLFHIKKTKEGIPILTIAFGTTASPLRLSNMRLWITQKLTDIDKLADNSLFLLTRLPHAIDKELEKEIESVKRFGS